MPIEYKDAPANTHDGTPLFEGHMTLFDAMLAWEENELDESQTTDLFQRLVDNGMAWSLQASTTLDRCWLSRSPSSPRCWNLWGSGMTIETNREDAPTSSTFKLNQTHSSNQRREETKHGQSSPDSQTSPPSRKA